MPLISTLGNIGAQSFGNRGLRYGGSAFFDAGGDYLTAPLSSAFSYPGNFTIEMWIYPTSLSILNLLWRQNNGVYLWISPTGQIGWYHGNNPWSFSSATVTANQWNHVAVVRNAGTVTIYVNGVGSGSVFNANAVGVGFNPLIGSWDGTANYQFYGYLTNLRIAKQALYTANFTPSGIPLTVNSQGSTTTQLLLNMRTASTLITDSSSNNFALANVNVIYSDFTPFLQPYVTPPVVVLQSATVTPTTFTPSEGTTITFNVVGTNTPNGTYYYTIEEDIATGAVTGADFTGGTLSGTFSISGNSGSFPLTVSRDLLTEGSEEFNVYVRRTSITGPILGTTGNIIISDTSLTPAFTVTPASINEGSAGSFTVANVGADGTYFWTILNGTTDSADFSASSGSFVVSGSTGGIDNGTGTFSVTTLSDRVTEGSQTFQVQVRSGSTSGTVVATSSSVTVNDVSLTVSFSGPTNLSAEGGSATYTVSNLGPAGVYYWTILHGTTVSADFDQDNGFFTTPSLNGSTNFGIVATADNLTEGTENFQIQLRTGSISGPVFFTSGAITITDTSTTPVVPAFTTTPTFLSEGFSETFTVNNLGAAGTYYWTILNSTSSDADFSAVNGSFTTSTSNGPGSFSVSALLDYVTDSSETFQVQVRQGSISGTVLVTSSSVIIGDTSGTVTATPSPTTITEGTSTTISVSSSAIPSATYFWTVLNGTTTNADFTATSGSFGVFLNTGSFTVTAATDGQLEGAETFQVQIRTGSTSGTVIATTGTITISANST